MTSLCKLGATRDELREILGDRFDEFAQWMRGQTGAVCDGQTYDHDAQQYVASGCGPHGLVVYRWDLDRFLAGLPVID